MASVLLPFTMANPLLVNLGYAALVSHHRLPSSELSRRLLLGAPRCSAGASYAVRALSRISRQAPSRPSRFRGPVSILWGRKDRLVPISHEQMVMTVFPQAGCQALEGVGHHPQHESPEAVLETLSVLAYASPTARPGVSKGRHRRRPHAAGVVA